MAKLEHSTAESARVMLYVYASDNNITLEEQLLLWWGMIYAVQWSMGRSWPKAKQSSIQPCGGAKGWHKIMPVRLTANTKRGLMLHRKHKVYILHQCNTTTPLWPYRSLFLFSVHQDSINSQYFRIILYHFPALSDYHIKKIRFCSLLHIMTT